MWSFISSILIITKTINCLNRAISNTVAVSIIHGNSKEPLDLSIKTNPPNFNDVEQLPVRSGKDSPRLIPSSSKRENSSKETLNTKRQQKVKDESRNFEIRTSTGGREKISHHQKIENFLKEFELDKLTAINPNKVFFMCKKQKDIIFQTKINIKLEENLYKHIFLYIDEKKFNFGFSSKFQGRFSQSFRSSEQRYFFIPSKKLRVITFETRDLLEDLFLDGNLVDLRVFHNKRLFENVSRLKSKAYHLIKRFDALTDKNFGYLYVEFEFVALQETETKGTETGEAKKLSVTLNIENAKQTDAYVKASSFGVSSSRVKFSIKEEDTSEVCSQGGSLTSNHRGNIIKLDDSSRCSYKRMQLLNILKSLRMDMEILPQEDD